MNYKYPHFFEDKNRLISVFKFARTNIVNHCRFFLSKIINFGILAKTKLTYG